MELQRGRNVRGKCEKIISVDSIGWEVCLLASSGAREGFGGYSPRRNMLLPQSEGEEAFFQRFLSFIVLKNRTLASRRKSRYLLVSLLLLLYYLHFAIFAVEIEELLRNF